MVDITDQFANECLAILRRADTATVGMRAVLEYAFGHQEPVPATSAAIMALAEELAAVRDQYGIFGVAKHVLDAGMIARLPATPDAEVTDADIENVAKEASNMSDIRGGRRLFWEEMPEHQHRLEIDRAKDVLSACNRLNMSGRYISAADELLRLAHLRIATLEAELVADSEAVSELRDDLERTRSELAAKGMADIWLGDTAPWLFRPALQEFSIVGMNHYHVAGERRLFVSMGRDGRLIKAEGRDGIEIWDGLEEQAIALRASAAPKPDPVDWLKIAEATRAAGSHLIGYDKDAIITGLCEQLTALRAGGAV